MRRPELPDVDHLVRDLEALASEVDDARAKAYIEQAREDLGSPAQPGLGGPTDEPDIARPALARLIDHTQLKPEATEADIRQICEEAAHYGFASVCVHPSFVPLAFTTLRDTRVRVCTVIGFPLGATLSAAKAHEARLAVQYGADELDMVLAIGRLKGAQLAEAEADIRDVVEAAHDAAAARDDAPVAVKVIIETALLTDVEKVIACSLALHAGADFVKTSTGFSTGGAKADDVALMRQVVGDGLGVKASGGVGSARDVQRMVAYGATRIGASGSVAIMEGLGAEGQSAARSHSETDY